MARHRGELRRAAVQGLAGLGLTREPAANRHQASKLCGAAIRLSNHSVHRPSRGPRAVKSAGKINKAPAAAIAAADGAGAASLMDGESAPPPQKKGRHEEGGSK